MGGVEAVEAERVTRAGIGNQHNMPQHCHRAAQPCTKKAAPLLAGMEGCALTAAAMAIIPSAIRADCRRNEWRWRGGDKAGAQLSAAAEQRSSRGGSAQVGTRQRRAAPPCAGAPVSACRNPPHWPFFRVLTGSAHAVHAKVVGLHPLQSNGHVEHSEPVQMPAEQTGRGAGAEAGERSGESVPAGGEVCCRCLGVRASKGWQRECHGVAGWRVGDRPNRGAPNC
jgi:hypothetical protein